MKTAARSPCLDCRIHLEGISKTNSTCRKCEKRVAYADSMDPENLTARRFGGGGVEIDTEMWLPDFAVTVPDPGHWVAKMEKKTPETKICRRCGNRLSLSAFGRSSKTRDGKNHTCSGCWSEALRSGWMKRRDVMKKPGADEAKVSADKAAPETIIPIDFSVADGLLDLLKQSAVDDFRSLNGQVLYLIKQGLSGRRLAGQ